MRNPNEKAQFWLNAEFSLWEQLNDPIQPYHIDPQIEPYRFKIPPSQYFAMISSLRGARVE